MAGEVGIEPTYHGFGDQAISCYLYAPVCLGGIPGVEPRLLVPQTSVLPLHQKPQMRKRMF